MAWLFQAQTTTKGIQLGNEEWSHLMEIGSNWTKIRVGCRIALQHNQNFIGSDTGTLVLGLNTGTSATYRSANCTEFMGFRLGNSTLPTFTFATSPAAHFFNGRPDLIYKIGGAITAPGAFSANEYISGLNATRTMAFVDITKNGGTSNNYSMTAYIPGNTTQATTDNGFSGFIQSMENNTTPLNCGTIGPTTFTYSGPGLFDTLYISWSRSVPALTVFDLAAARIW